MSNQNKFYSSFCQPLTIQELEIKHSVHPRLGVNTASLLPDTECPETVSGMKCNWRRHLWVSHISSSLRSTIHVARISVLLVGMHHQWGRLISRNVPIRAIATSTFLIPNLSLTKCHLSMLLLFSSHGIGDASNVANARND